MLDAHREAEGLPMVRGTSGGPSSASVRRHSADDAVSSQPGADVVFDQHVETIGERAKLHGVAIRNATTVATVRHPLKLGKRKVRPTL